MAPDSEVGGCSSSRGTSLQSLRLPKKYSGSPKGLRNGGCSSSTLKSQVDLEHAQAPGVLKRKPLPGRSEPTMEARTGIPHIIFPHIIYFRISFSRAACTNQQSRISGSEDPQILRISGSDDPEILRSSGSQVRRILRSSNPQDLRI